MKKIIVFVCLTIVAALSYSKTVECWAPKFNYNKLTKEFKLHKNVHVRAKHYNWTISEFDAFYAVRYGEYLQIEYAIQQLRNGDRNMVSISDMQQLDMDFCTMTDIESRKYVKQ